VAVVGAATVALGLASGERDLVAVGAALLAALALGLARVARRPRLVVARPGPDRVGEGETVELHLTVSNRGHRRSPALVVHDHLARTPLPVALPALAPGADHTVTHRLRSPARGRHPLGPVQLVRTDGLGLVRATRDLGGGTALWVHPRMHTLRPPPMPWDPVTGRADGRAGPGGVTFHRLRDYRPGDDVRHIHWPSSARAGGLLVRDTVVPAEPGVVVVLDTATSAYDGGDRFEHAVRVAASLLAAGAGAGHPVRLRTTAGLAAEPGRPGPPGALLDALTLVQPTAGDPGLPGLAGAGDLARATGFLVVVTGGSPTRPAGVLALLARRFSPVALVQVAPGDAGGSDDDPGPAVALSVRAPSSTGVADAWNALMAGPA
jgi:uncharacterized protein (DUF58 family)